MKMLSSTLPGGIAVWILFTLEGAVLVNQVPSYSINCQELPAQTTILKLTLLRGLVREIQVYHHQ